MLAQVGSDETLPERRDVVPLSLVSHPNVFAPPSDSPPLAAQASLGFRCHRPARLAARARRVRTSTARPSAAASRPAAAARARRSSASSAAGPTARARRATAARAAGAIVARAFAARLRRLLAWVRGAARAAVSSTMSGSRRRRVFTASSLLLVYEGDEAAAADAGVRGGERERERTARARSRRIATPAGVCPRTRRSV